MAVVIDNILTEKEKCDQQKLKTYKPLVYEKMIRYNEKLARGEPIPCIILQYRYHCNMRCIHCCVDKFRMTKNKRMVTLFDVKNLADQADALGLGNFAITGGETTMFKDFDQLIAAIGPERFWIQTDTNGWLLDDKLAKHWKSIGLDKVDISLDSMDEKAHDEMRQMNGSWKKAIEAIDHCNNNGLSVLINTVVTGSRIRTQEFIDFLEFLKTKNAATMVCWAHPSGKWEKFTDFATREDGEYLMELGEKYNVFDHSVSKGYGRYVGCMGVKRVLTINGFGDAMPCSWLGFKLGSIFNNSLQEILDKGMKYFGNFESTCLTGTNREFIEKYIYPLHDREIPAPIEETLPIDWQEQLKNENIVYSST